MVRKIIEGVRGKGDAMCLATRNLDGASLDSSRSIATVDAAVERGPPPIAPRSAGGDACARVPQEAQSGQMGAEGEEGTAFVAATKSPRPRARIYVPAARAASST